MRHILRQSAPFALAAILAAVQGRVNILLLEQLSSAAQVGYYAAAFKFLEAARLVPLAFFDALFPRLATLAEHPPQLERLFRRILGALAGYGLVVGLGLNLIAHGLMGIYGTAFLPASTVLQVGAWSLLPLLLKQGRTLYWYAQGQEQHVNRITLMVLALQIVLALWLIPSGQALGAAVALILSESCAALLLWRGKRVRVVSERLTSAP
jgi:O-antigen/teichoic acid export membrane protein